MRNYPITVTFAMSIKMFSDVESAANAAGVKTSELLRECVRLSLDTAKVSIKRKKEKRNEN